MSQQNATGYAVTYLIADAEQKDVTLQMGSNDQAKIYVNGKQVVKNETARGIDKDQDKSEPLTLKKGVNVVRAAIINAGGATDFCARFLDANARPIAGLTIDLAATPGSS